MSDLNADKEEDIQEVDRSLASVAAIRERIQEGSFSEIFRDWKWIFSYTKKYKWAVLFYTVIGIVSSTLSLISAVASKYSIDIITGYHTEKLPLLIGIMVGTFALSLLLNSLVSRISARLSLYIYNDIQKEVFSKIIDSDWLELNRFSNGDIINRFNADITTVANNAITWLPTILITLYQFAATFGLIWYYSKAMAVISFLSAPVMLLSSRFMISRQRYYNRRTKEMSSELMTFEMESIYNLDTIKSFGIMNLYTEKLAGWQKKYKTLALKYNWFTILTNAVFSVTGMIVQFAAFGYCLYLLWEKTITYGTMTLFLQQRSKLTSAFNQLVSIIPNFLNSSVSANRIRELVELPKEKHLGTGEIVPEDFSGGITVRVDDVDCSYDPEIPVLRDVNLEAGPGEIVALIGPSGEGKTTMIRLLLGLIPPKKGEVILSGSGKAISSNADTRSLFSYVPQGNTILSGTIAENMRIVKPEATDEEIIDALHQASAWSFVQNIPDTIHGRLGEKGKGLSEGQAQRIAIARAILRDAPVLLLDEATSALDVVTEQQVLKNIVNRSPDKTVIVTTHRPSVLSVSDRIYNVRRKSVKLLTEEESSGLVMDYN